MLRYESCTLTALVLLLMNPFLFPRNLVTSLVEHEQIQTTLAKAKETSRLAEKVRPRYSSSPTAVC